jgi:hypothetical protein
MAENKEKRNLIFALFPAIQNSLKFVKVPKSLGPNVQYRFTLDHTVLDVELFFRSKQN